MQKNEQLDVTIQSLGTEGQGIGRCDTGMAVFVEGALPGERVRVQIIKLAQRYAVGKLLEVLEPSAQRVTPTCAAYPACGGCQLMHLDYPAQLEAKRQQVADALARIGGIDAPVLPCLGMDEPWRFRNKGQFPIGLLDQGPAVGFYALRSHRLIPLADCPVLHPAGAAALGAVQAYLDRERPAVYDERTRRGELRHLMVRVGAQTGQVMVVLVTRTPSPLPGFEGLLAGLRQAVPGLTSVIQNVHPEPTNVVLGRRNITRWGADVICDRIDGLSFSIAPNAFFQVNPGQTQVLYGQALRAAELTGREVVFDAYCGVGTISLMLARRAAQVYGVEIVAPAVENARENARCNGIANAQFHVGACEDIFPQLLAQGIRPDVVVVDPPRKGCEASLLTAIAQAAPARIVYVSCSPGTLARDCKLLGELGYRVSYAQPVDMFGHTGHVETVIMMTYCGQKEK